MRLIQKVRLLLATVRYLHLDYYITWEHCVYETEISKTNRNMYGTKFQRNCDDMFVGSSFLTPTTAATRQEQKKLKISP